MTIPLSIIGIDLGNVGDGKGTVLLHKKLNRHQRSEFAATTARWVVAMESCAARSSGDGCSPRRGTRSGCCSASS
jgi:hypothetical protein